MFLMFWFCVVD